MSQLRPLSIGEILDVAFKLYFRHWKTFMAIVALIAIPAAALTGLIIASTIDFASKGKLYYVDNSAQTSGVIVILVVALVALLLITACAFRAVSQAYLGHRPSLGESIRFALPRLFSLLWIFILAGLGTVIGFLLLVIPGVYLLVAWFAVVPVLLVEGAKGSRALGRSRELVKGRWWSTFGVLLVLGILISVTSAIGQQVASALLSSSSSVATIVTVTQVVDALTRIVTEPIAVAGVVVLYFDLRVRREGFDVSLMIDQLGFAPPVAPAGYATAASAFVVGAAAGVRPGTAATGCRAAGCTAGARLRTARRTRHGEADRVAWIDGHRPARGSEAALRVSPPATSDPREIAREILHERRFHRASLPHPLRAPLRWLGDQLRVVGHGLRDAFNAVDDVIPGGSWLAWVVLGLLVAVAVVALTRHSLRRAQGTAAARAEAGSDGPSARQLEREADAAERAGRYDEALRLRFGAGLLTLAQRGVIERRPSLRSGEVAAALHSERFDAIAHDFDEVVYGGRPADEQDATAARSGWRDVLATERR